MKKKYLFIDAAWLLLLAALPVFLALRRNYSIPVTSTPSPVANSVPVSVSLPTLEPPSVTTIYYDITGSNEKELGAQLHELGPVAPDGYKGQAMTRWDIRWNWPGYGTSTCNLKALRITYKVKITLPRWTPPRNAPPDLIKKWSDYIRKLEEHEQGHVNIVKDNYQPLIDAIKGATCDTAEETGQAILERIRQQDIDYDTETDHGRTEGAVFP